MLIRALHRRSACQTISSDLQHTQGRLPRGSRNVPLSAVLDAKCLEARTGAAHELDARDRQTKIGRDRPPSRVVRKTVPRRFTNRDDELIAVQLGGGRMRLRFYADGNEAHASGFSAASS